MKTITRIFIALLSLAAVGFLAVVMIDPQKGQELQEKLVDLVNQRSELLEVSPVRELSIAYELPFEDYDRLYEEYHIEYGLDTNYPDTVYTWFRDLERDLWLPFQNEQLKTTTVGETLLLDQDGVVKRGSAEECPGDSITGEVCIPRSFLEDVPEGDYWVALLAKPDHPQLPYDGPYYILRYLAIYDECDFHTEDYEISNGGGGEVLVDRSTGEGYTFHLLNLGDNIVTDVWKLENMAGEFHQKHLKEGEDYILPEDGASVTLTPEYLDSLQDLYGYPFLFGLGDHSEVCTIDEDKERYLSIFLTDGPIADPPFIDGPESYSVSSGEDYVFTLHLGRAINIQEPYCSLTFSQEDGTTYYDDFGNIISYYRFLNEEIQEDDTYVIPAEVFQEAAQRGDTSAWLGINFQVTQFAASSYCPYMGYPIYLEP